MGKLILIGTPQLRNVPYFAMGAPWSKETKFEFAPIDKSFEKLAGRQRIKYLAAKAQEGDPKVLHTRNFIPPKSALYANWLYFRSPSRVAQYLEAFPNSEIDEQIAQMTDERDSLARVLESRRLRGDFDLSKIGDEEQRKNLAQKYVTLAEEIHSKADPLLMLQMAKDVAPEWEAVLSKEESIDPDSDC